MKKFIGIVFALLIIGAGVYFGLQFYKKNQDLKKTEDAINQNPNLRNKAAERARAKGTTTKSEIKRMAKAILKSQKK